MPQSAPPVRPSALPGWPERHERRDIAAGAALLLRDAGLAARFDRRVAGFWRLVFPLWGGLALFQTLIAPSVTHLAHGAVMLLAAVAVLAARDGVNRLVYGGTALTFSVMLYLNATLHLQPATAGLIDPLRAATIVLAAQAGVTLVALADRLVPECRPEYGPGYRPEYRPGYRLGRLSAHLPAPASGRALRMQGLALGLFAVVLAGLALDLAGRMPAILAESLRCLMPVPVALRFLSRPATARDPWLLALAGLAVLVAVRSNARADLLGAGLLLGFLGLIHAGRLVTLPRLVLLWLGLRFTAVFSAVSLAVRPLREDPALMLDEFRRRLLSPETLRALADPFHVHSAHAAFDQRQTDTLYFASGFFHGPRASLFDRLTLLPQMDIVTGRLPAPAPDLALWLRATVGAVLPNLGQDKLTMLGDALVWDLALRPRDSVGRPMVTAQAEAWSTGGHPMVFLTACLLFGAWAVNWRLLNRLVGLRSVTIPMAAMFMVYALFSTTLASQSLSLLRMPLQTMAALGLMLGCARLWRPRPHLRLRGAG